MQKRTHGSTRSLRRKLTVSAATLAVVGGIGVFGVNMASADETDGQPAPPNSQPAQPAQPAPPNSQPAAQPAPAACNPNALPETTVFGGERAGTDVFGNAFGCDPGAAEAGARAVMSRQCTNFANAVLEDERVNLNETDKEGVTEVRMEGRCV